jgi:hypothetical protein
VLTYAHSGAQHLQALLSADPGLACTAGTGLLAACESAAAAWRQVDPQTGPGLSALAIKSTRALAINAITIILVRTAKNRWCELATAPANYAETFAQLFPQTRFICVHRACPDFIADAIQASPWGLSGPHYASYLAAHPASTVAALTAYWVSRTAALLEFESAHPRTCQRVRYEDCTASPTETVSKLSAFLGIRPTQDNNNDAGRQALSTTDDLPVGQIPPPLLAEMNNLHAALGYAQI